MFPAVCEVMAVAFCGDSVLDVVAEQLQAPLDGIVCAGSFGLTTSRRRIELADGIVHYKSIIPYLSG